MKTAKLPEHLSFDEDHVDNYLRGYPLAKVIPTVLHDLERVPEKGPALLVGNHGPFAIDTGLLMHAFHRDTGKVLRGLSDRMLFSNAVGRQMVRNVGGVLGTRDNALSLLAHGELVLVYPGGARETVRGAAQRYQLDWEGRLGFARMALMAQVPIIPVACIGMDDLFTQVVDGAALRSSSVGRFMSQFIKTDYIPPIYFPKLRQTQFHYYFGEPIAPLAFHDEGDEATVVAHQQAVKSALEQLVEHGRQVRRERLAAKAQRKVA